MFTRGIHVYKNKKILFYEIFQLIKLKAKKGIKLKEWLLGLWGYLASFVGVWYAHWVNDKG